MTPKILRRAWIETATEQADLAKVHYSLVLGDCRVGNAVRARWNAYKIILDAYPRASIKGLAGAVGVDHTTIIYGLKRLSGASVKDTKVHGIASGRRPALRVMGAR